MDRALSDSTTPIQSVPGNDDNEGVLRIPWSSSITGTSPSDRVVSYAGHSLGGGILPHCREAVDVFYSLADWAIIKSWRSAQTPTLHGSIANWSGICVIR